MQKKKENSGERYRKIIKRRRIFVLSILLLIILLCVCLFTPVFGISDISVTGNTLLASEDIIAASGIEKGENVFRISGKKAARKLSKLAYVEGAKIKRKFHHYKVSQRTIRICLSLFLAFENSWMDDVS